MTVEDWRRHVASLQTQIEQMGAGPARERLEERLAVAARILAEVQAAVSDSS